MKSTRASGVLLHPSSLPGPDGIGDIGPESLKWIQFLVRAGCSIWQVLPLGPTGYGDSPYQCFSAFAGNPYLVSPAGLLEEGLLTRADLAERPNFSAERVDFGAVITWKMKLLQIADKRFQSAPEAQILASFNQFCEENAFWLDDYALFMAIKSYQGGVSWTEWDPPYRNRHSAEVNQVLTQQADQVRSVKFFQYLFFSQWKIVREYAQANQIKIIGDAPIFVSLDSADVWAHPELFQLDAHKMPTAVAGVPPDYFSPTGQLWGNPLYDWSAHQNSGYAWWIQRIQTVLKLVDLIRLDHFRGFAGYWKVPADAKTAESGKWIPGPGIELFHALCSALGSLPIIAEDLGEITPDVIALRDDLNLPGMKILQFAFANDAEDPFLPHNYIPNCVAYTGTHDNDTSIGWYTSAPESERDLIRRYLARSGEDIAWDMIRSIWSSVADTVIVPLQDCLNLDSSGRMNFPGKPSGNWQWRFRQDQLPEAVARRLYELNELYNRLPQDQKKPHKPAQTPGYFL